MSGRESPRRRTWERSHPRRMKRSPRARHTSTLKDERAPADARRFSSRGGSRRYRPLRGACDRAGAGMRIRSYRGAAARGIGAGWRTRSSPDENARELGTSSDVPAGRARRSASTIKATRFVRDVEVAGGEAGGERWTRIRAARRLMDRAGVRADGMHGALSLRARRGCERARRREPRHEVRRRDRVAAFELAPSADAVRSTGVHYRFHVRAAEGVSFATGVTADSEPDTYGADVGDLELAPYSVSGTMRTRAIHVKGAAPRPVATCPESSH